MKPFHILIPMCFDLHASRATLCGKWAKCTRPRYPGPGEKPETDVGAGEKTKSNEPPHPDGPMDGSRPVRAPRQTSAGRTRDRGRRTTPHRDPSKQSKRRNTDGGFALWTPSSGRGQPVFVASWPLGLGVGEGPECMQILLLRWTLARRSVLA